MPVLRSFVFGLGAIWLVALFVNAFTDSGTVVEVGSWIGLVLWPFLLVLVLIDEHKRRQADRSS